MATCDCKHRLGKEHYTDSRVRMGMGGYITVNAEAPDAVSLERGIGAAFQAILQVESLMHPTRHGSNLAAINASVPGAPVRVHPWTWEVLDICKRVHHQSHGIFDPCLPQAAGRLGDLGMPEASIVTRRTLLLIDLGGIAKGYAVDQAIAALQETGCTSGWVNAGGDMRTFGPQAQEIVCRDQEAKCHVVRLQDGALAASQVDHPLRPSEHRGYYHGTNGAGTAAGSVAVLAQTAAVADALAKCLLVERRQSHAALLAAFDARQIH